jgi:ribosome assembly protein 4
MKVAPPNGGSSQGVPFQELYGHSGRVFDATFSPDGSKIATASEDTMARVWNVSLGTPVSLLAGHTAEVLRVAWRPDGALLSTGELDSLHKHAHGA